MRAQCRLLLGQIRQNPFGSADGGIDMLIGVSARKEKHLELGWGDVYTLLTHPLVKG